MFLNSVRMSQNKAIHCYILMTVWILLIVIGIYKFTETKEKNLGSTLKPIEPFNNLKVDIKIQRILKICNLPDDIEQGDEGRLFCIFKKNSVTKCYHCRNTFKELVFERPVVINKTWRSRTIAACEKTFFDKLWFRGFRVSESIQGKLRLAHL